MGRPFAPYLVITDSRFNGEGKERQRASLTLFPEHPLESGDSAVFRGRPQYSAPVAFLRFCVQNPLSVCHHDVEVSSTTPQASILPLSLATLRTSARNESVL